MSPEELAWAFGNSRAPAAQQATSADFAAHSRSQTEDLDRRFLEEQHAQDVQYNRTVHAQDMAAAQAHHNALMGQYSLVNQVRGELGMNVSSFDWKQGFVIGLAVGALAASIWRAWR